MNQRIALTSSAVTLCGVAGFAVAMLVGSLPACYVTSLFISWGFVPMMCSFAMRAGHKAKVAAYTGMAFAAAYVVIINLVYFAQLTTVRQTALSGELSGIFDFSKLGSLYFNYDLLGYAIMALSTFFIGLTIEANSKPDKALRVLLLVHGIFFPACIIVPMTGAFSGSGSGGDMIGTIMLLIWCVYFAPVCILSLRRFHRDRTMK